jgi:hypothetical protein
MLYDSPTMLAGKGNTGITPAEKLTIVANRYNMPGLLQMQPSEQNIFDSIDCSTFSTAGSTTVQFFSNVNNKSFPFTNLQQNQLKAGNVIVVMYVQFAIMTFSVDASGVPIALTNIRTIEEAYDSFAPTTATNLKPILGSQMTLVIGSSEVFKDLPIINAYAGFNPNSTFGTKTASPAANNPIVQYGSSNIDLASEPVILPQLEFKLNLQIPRLSAVPATGTQWLRATIGGFGTIPAMAKPM